MAIDPSLHRSLLSPYRIACARQLRGRILDVGGGLGDYLPYFNGEVVLADVNHEALRQAPLEARVQASGEHLPFHDSSFDAAWPAPFAQYLDLTRFVAELKRVTRNGGCIMLLVPNARSPWDGLKRLLGHETGPIRSASCASIRWTIPPCMAASPAKCAFCRANAGCVAARASVVPPFMLDITVAK